MPNLAFSHVRRTDFMRQHKNKELTSFVIRKLLKLRYIFGVSCLGTLYLIIFIVYRIKFDLIMNEIKIILSFKVEFCSLWPVVLE